jgi:predicted nucleotidyltransferase
MIRPLTLATRRGKKRRRIAVCRRHDVPRLEAFGSILRDDFNDDLGDVDVLVEFGQRLRYCIEKSKLPVDGAA